VVWEGISLGVDRRGGKQIVPVKNETKPAQVGGESARDVDGTRQVDVSTSQSNSLVRLNPTKARMMVTRANPLVAVYTINDHRHGRLLL
jgi:hypothetical protein